MKRTVRLTESDLHRIVKETVNRAINEVALKGKSGKTYSLHGNDEESWDIVSRLRQKKSGNSNYNTMRDEKNAEEIDAKKHPNRRSLNNANRVNALLKRTSNASKDIMAANESKLSRIVKESVNRILKEGFTKPSNWKDTPFKGTYEDENGTLYMPDDDYGNEGFPYMIVTYNGEEEVNREYVTLPKPNLHAYDDEVPFSLGSNQALIELD